MDQVKPALLGRWANTLRLGLPVQHQPGAPTTRKARKTLELSEVDPEAQLGLGNCPITSVGPLAPVPCFARSARDSHGNFHSKWAGSTEKAVCASAVAQAEGCSPIAQAFAGGP